ncbi:MAG: glycogen/starch synthase [Muribaculaceae bacterium]|nr:glycogen/starch synthase [Muribaculaceae bacterium]
MAAKKILFVSQEIAPYLPANEISSFGKALPQSLQGKRFEVRTFMPKFGNVNERRNQLHEVIRLSGLNIEINDNDHPLILKVASMQPVRIQVYFIDNDDYFTKVDDDIDAVGSNRADNDERALYFARGTMETVKKLKWDPEIIQCSGWITALTPAYMRSLYTPDSADAPTPKIIYCVEPSNPDMAPIDPELVRKLIEDGLPADLVEKYKAETMDVNTLHRIAIDNSDAVVFLTPDPDPALAEYVAQKGLPVLTRQDVDEKGVAQFPDFYESI